MSSPRLALTLGQVFLLYLHFQMEKPGSERGVRQALGLNLLWAGPGRDAVMGT